MLISEFAWPATPAVNPALERCRAGAIRVNG